MRLVIIGSGYVGLVSGACLADFGHNVVCVDKDLEKIAALRKGQTPIFEPGLSEVVSNNLAQGRLSFTNDLGEALRGAQVVFIAVGTPPVAGGQQADISSVLAVAREIAGFIDDHLVVVIKSTVPVGTGDRVEEIIKAAAPSARFSVVSNPEFLREGSAIKDFKLPDRIVIGVEDALERQVMANVYRPLYLNQGPVVFTGRRTAELVKYAANAFLAMKVAFINEIGDFCETAGADVQDVARCIGLDNRIGTKFLNAGPGFGGSCFPKDMLALAASARDAGTPLRIVETVTAVNESRKLAMAEKVIKACGGSVANARIAVLGLTFKPNTDDMRSAPSLVIVPTLLAAGAQVVAFEPKGERAARELLPGVEFADSPYACVAGADALVIITEWEAFRALDLPRVKAAMRRPVIVDLRNIYRSEEMKAMGFHYVSVGRGARPRSPERFS